MVGYYGEGHHNPCSAEDEAGSNNFERDPSPEWQIPLSWVTAWVGGLSTISLGLGLALKWLLQ